MNAPFPDSDQVSTARYCSMEGQVAQWRGECLQRFAELEQIVENLLRELQRSSRHGGKVKAGQPVGPAFKHLRELTGSKGPFAAKGQAISATLAALALWFEWRAHLTHGVVDVWRGRSQWLVTLAHRGTGEDTIRTHALTWRDALRMQKLLDERVPALRDNAKSLTNSVQKP